MPDTDDKYNLMAEVLASVNRVPAAVDAHNREIHTIVAAWAKAFYDFGPMVDAKHDYLISQQSTHKADIEAKIDKFLLSIDAKVDRFLATITEHVIAIRTATALTANDAGDAKDAADDAKDAANAARTAHESGAHTLFDEHGHPIHGGPRQPQETPRTPSEKQNTPASVTAGVAGSVASVIRELIKDLPWPAKLLLAIIALVGTLISGQAIEAKWKLFGGGPGLPAIEHRPDRPHLDTPKLEAPKLEAPPPTVLVPAPALRHKGAP